MNATAPRTDWYRLSAGRERLRSLGSLAEERRRLLGAADAVPDSGRDPAQLDRQALRIREEQAALEQLILDRRGALDNAAAAKLEAENAASAEDSALHVARQYTGYFGPPPEYAFSRVAKILIIARPHTNPPTWAK